MTYEGIYKDEIDRLSSDLDKKEAEIEHLRVINKKLLDAVYSFQSDAFNAMYALEKRMDEIEESIAKIEGRE